uniref:Uncharacterized protein n=1 Tax=Escherichia coli TaxID=562 RepID=G4VUV0_ECOLX|nr:hypothetical protein HUS41_pIII0015 [Escherichia coli]
MFSLQPPPVKTGCKNLVLLMDPITIKKLDYYLIYRIRHIDTSTNLTIP